MSGDSVFLISSKEVGNENFGSAFAIYKSKASVYLLTCAHVVKDVGGPEQVKVDDYKVKVLFQSSLSDTTDDLAIIQIEGISDVPVLPLADCGEMGLPFCIFGWYLYDRRNGDFKSEVITGILGKPGRSKIKEQIGSTKTWDLKLDDGNLLQHGFSGAPVIDRDKRVVIGVVRYLEGKGEKGRAITVGVFTKVWQEVSSSSLVRQEVYNLEKIKGKLQIIFGERKEEFVSFCQESFDFKPTEIAYSVAVEMLITYCHERNECGKLLFCLDKYVSSRERKLTYFLSYLLDSYNYFFRRKKHVEYRGHGECQVTFKTGLPPEKYSVIVRAMATELQVCQEILKVTHVREGSLILTLQMPSSEINRLIDLYEANDPVIRDLGIEYVMELISELYDFDKIHKLLSNMIADKDVIAFCYKEFEPAFLELSSDYDKFEISDNDKFEIIENIIKYARMESRVKELLDFLKRYDAKRYDKYGSYYRIARRPSEKRSSTRYSAVQLIRLVVASIYGMGTTTGGTLLLSLLPLFITTNASEEFIFLASFSWLFLVPLGSFVGNMFSKIAGFRSQKAAVVALISFLVGYQIGLASAFLAVGYVSPEEIQWEWVQFFTYFLVGTVSMLLNVLSDPVGALFLVKGGYNVYAEVRYK